MRRRLDLELVRRGLAPSRSAAQELIARGRVTVGGAPADKTARLVGAAEPVELLEPDPYASRAGHKLAAALDRFGVDPAHRRVIDAGASTGGFTDVLLRRGAAEVVAVDVGRGQLLTRLARDSRVAVHDGTNVRHLDPADLGGPASLVVADLSFISLVTVLDALVGLTAVTGELVVLVKPQFEVGRAVARRSRGVVREPEQWSSVLQAMRASAAAAGARMVGVMAAPLTGSDGNVEFPAHLVLDPGAVQVDDGAVDAAVSEARSVLRSRGG